jgi:hypothetical protein
MATSYPSVIDNMMSDPSPQPQPAAYHRAIQNTAPKTDELDALRMKFGFVAPSIQSPTPFWRALAQTLAGQHDASDALQEFNKQGNAAQVGASAVGASQGPQGPQAGQTLFPQQESASPMSMGQNAQPSSTTLPNNPSPGT